MSIYTCFDMIPDCKANKPEGWLYLVRMFAPPLRRLVESYGGGEEQFRALLAGLRDFPDIPPAVEREFLLGMRPRILDAAGWKPRDAGTLDLETFIEALEELTALERQAVWFETFPYPPAKAALMTRMSEDTHTKARERAAELLRVKLDNWTATIVRDNAAGLSEAVRAAIPAQPTPFRSYIDVIDGRMTWATRVAVARGLAGSWYEVDHFCRVREADAAIRDTKPLDHAAAEPWLAIFGVRPPKQPVWKRLLVKR